MNLTERRSDCPISLALDIFGDKWTLLIIRDFIFFDNRHFNELVSLEKISTNILTNRLNRLVEHGLIKKEVDPYNKSSFLYSLTKKGLGLVPLVIGIYRWGAHNTHGNNAEEPLKSRINSDFEGFTQEIMERLATTHHIE